MFMKQAIPLANLTDNDLITSITLQDKVDLNARVFMENSLTNYLHQLAPDLSNEQILQSGNFQFTFYLDQQLIYVENLHKGAGSPEIKNRATTLRIPLLSTQNEDSWGLYLWKRFLLHGGEEALQVGVHRLKIEIRPYLLLTELKVGPMIAQGELELVIPEVKVDPKLSKWQDIQVSKAFKVSKHPIDTTRIISLNEGILSKKYKDITSVVVLKGGELVIEEYFQGASRKTLHDTRSVGKSFASTLLGMAIQDGYISSDTARLMEFYDLKKYKNYSPAKDSITLRQLLTMQTPFDGSDRDENSPGHEEKMYASKNWVELILNLPLDSLKLAEQHWDYLTGGVVVLGDIIDKAVPKGLEHYAKVKLFEPLQITKVRWQHTPQKVANTAGGIQLSSIDLAKYGQLYLNRGVWDGNILVAKDWIDQSLSKKTRIDANRNYGYLFWNRSYRAANVATNTSDTSTEWEAYYANGNGGNRVMVFKELELVVVITSKAYNSPSAEKQVDYILENHLLPALLYPTH